MKSLVGYSVGLDVDTDLLQDQFILFLQEGDLDTGTSDQNLGLSLDTGDDVALFGDAFT